MANKQFPKIGLALGSGSAKGFAHVGVLKTLQKHNIPIDYISGSSVGAFIGAHYAAHRDPQRIEDIILDFNKVKGLQLVDLTMKGGILKGNRIEKFISESLQITDFTDTQIPFTALATDLNTAEEVVLYKGDIVKAIRASISIPAFFRPVHYQKRLLADGGLSNTVPVDVVRNMGADITIAVNLDTVYVEKPFTDLSSLAKVPLHSINILRHNLAKQAVKTADIIIVPGDTSHIGLVGWAYFTDTEKAKKIIQAGEEATEAIIPQLQNRITSYTNQLPRFRKFFSFFTRPKHN